MNLMNHLFKKLILLLIIVIEIVIKKYFHTFEYKCEYDIKLTNITNNEIINITISGKNQGLLELNKKLTIARQ